MVSFLLTAPLANNPNLSSSFKMCFEQHYKLLNLNLFCVSIHYIFETFFFFNWEGMCMLQHTCGGQRTAHGCKFSLSTTCVPGMEGRLTGLVVST